MICQHFQLHSLVSRFVLFESHRRILVHCRVQGSIMSPSVSHQIVRRICVEYVCRLLVIKSLNMCRLSPVRLFPSPPILHLWLRHGRGQRQGQTKGVHVTSVFQRLSRIGSRQLADSLAQKIAVLHQLLVERRLSL